MRYCISVLLIFTFFLSAQAQDLKQNQGSRWQIRGDYYQPKSIVSFANASVNGYYFPKNLGFSIGVERDWKTKKRFRYYQMATLGFYNEVYFERVFTIETGGGLNFRLYEGLFLGSEISLGYNRAVSSHLTSVYDGTKWVTKTDKSDVTSRFIAGGGFQLGYDLNRHFNGKIPLTISAGLGGQIITPFMTGTPLNIYSNRKIGVKWRF
jgi:hypothetical protein